MEVGGLHFTCMASENKKQPTASPWDQISLLKMSFSYFHIICLLKYPTYSKGKKEVKRTGRVTQFGAVGGPGWRFGGQKAGFSLRFIRHMGPNSRQLMLP
eukprot:1152367-Pelagomonas_calceolata.AAC.1